MKLGVQLNCSHRAFMSEPVAFLPTLTLENLKQGTFKGFLLAFSAVANMNFISPSRLDESNNSSLGWSFRFN